MSPIHNVDFKERILTGIYVTMGYLKGFKIITFALTV